MNNSDRCLTDRESLYLFIYGVLATVKDTALNAVFAITLKLQFLNLGQLKKSYIIYNQLNLFSYLIILIDQHSNCIIHRSESGNTIFSIFV